MRDVQRLLGHDTCYRASVAGSRGWWDLEKPPPP